MKACEYCGRQNEEAAALCLECGSAFGAEASLSLTEIANWSPVSAIGLAFTSGLAALLLTTGIYLAAGRACLDIITASGGVPSAALGPGYHYMILMPPALGWFLAAGLTILIFAICSKRCLRRSHGIVTAVVVWGIVAFLKLVPGVWLFALPAVLLGASTNSSVVFYIGAALQLVVGAWLLGLFRQRRNQSETQSA